MKSKGEKKPKPKKKRCGKHCKRCLGRGSEEIVVEVVHVVRGLGEEGERRLKSDDRLRVTGEGSLHAGAGTQMAQLASRHVRDLGTHPIARLHSMKFGPATTAAVVV